MSVIENKQETRKPAKKSFDFKTAEIRFFPSADVIPGNGTTRRRNARTPIIYFGTCWPPV
jgi:hypothetical protein